MNKIAIVKQVTTIVLGFGTSRIINSIIKNNVPTENIAQEVSVTASSFVLGMMVAEKMQAFTDLKIDQIVAAFNRDSNETPVQ